MIDKPFLLVIGGPTGSGKSDLAMRIAGILPSEIVNADSMQIYRFLDIGTAKPDEEQRRKVPHHLLDIRDPDEAFSVGDYIKLSRKVVGEIVHRSNLPIMVGGTGLYIRGAIGGIFPGPPRNEKLRCELLALDKEDKGILYRRLKEVDPASAGRIHQGDLVRIVRALEVMELKGEPISALQDKHRFSDRPFRTEMICIDPDRDLLYMWIDQRVDQMMEMGFLEEVRHLAESGFGRDLNSMQGLGYSELMSHLNEEVSLEDAVSLIKKNTRRYAKRQMTWFRGEDNVRWIKIEDREQIGDVAADIVDRLGG
ncbi:MAG: tRNA (adenosine(37)-N6)-dimethylallyltransferase MiaA [bacterium]